MSAGGCLPHVRVFLHMKVAGRGWSWVTSGRAKSPGGFLKFPQSAGEKNAGEVFTADTGSRRGGRTA